MRLDPRAASRQRLALFVAVVLCEALLLGVVAQYRGVDADEGFYTFAAREVRDGQRIYSDFFFPQMPYLPFAAAALIDVEAPSLFAGRAVNVVSGAIAVGLLAYAGAAWTGRLSVGATVALLFAANALYVLLLSVGKTYGLANLGLIASFLLLARSRLGLLGAAAAGACAGVALGARLPAAAAIVILAAWSLRHGFKPFAAFAVGGVIASLPWLVVFARDPQAFWFCNFGFHELRREITSFDLIIAQKGIVLAKWLLLPQNAILWLAAAIGTWLEPRRGLPAMACALALAVGYLAATPTYLQYLVQILPFLVIAGVPAIAALLERRILLVLVAVVYIVGFAIAVRTPDDGTERSERVAMWRSERVEEVASFLRAHSEPGDAILSWWEGYPLLAHRESIKGVGFWESNVAKKLPLDLRRRYHVFGRDEVAAVIAARQPRLIVFPTGTWDEHAPAIAANYRLIESFASLQIWDRRRD